MKNRKKMVSILALVMAAVMVLSLILSLIPRASAASSSEIKQQINELKSQQAEIQNQKAELQTQYQENEDEIANIVAKKNIIDQEIFLLHAEIVNINDQISTYNLLIADMQDELDNAEANLETLNEEHKDRIRTMEEEGELSYWSVLFNARSLSDLLDRLNMIEEIAASDQRRLKALSEAAENVELAQQALEAEKVELQEVRNELDATNADLEAKQQEANDLIQELLVKCEEIEGLQEELEKEDEALLNEIAQKEKEYNQAKHQEWLEYMATYTTVPPETTTAPTTSGTTNNSTSTNSGTSSGTNSGTNSDTSSGAASSGTWIRPCSYVMVSSPFGNRKSPTAGASSYHQGVDLAGPAGTPIYAARTGVVTTATSSNSAGFYVSINHGDGYSSIYMHMTNYVVSPGQAVSAGQLIGYMGATGITTGPHLHFGIAYNGVYVNPALYVPL